MLAGYFQRSRCIESRVLTLFSARSFESRARAMCAGRGARYAEIKIDEGSWRNGGGGGVKYRVICPRG